MKNKKVVIGILCIAICAAFVLGLKTIPKHISFAQATDLTQALETLNEQKDNASFAMFKHLSEITQAAPYIIKSNGQDIFVCKDDKKLYKVNALLSDFPAADKLAIDNGILVESRQMLFEIISFLES